MEISDFNPIEATGAVIQMQKYRAEKHGIRISWEETSDIGVIHADERRFRQVLINILGNAVKFTPDGGAISVQLKRRKGGDLAVNDEDAYSPSEPVPGELRNQEYVEVSVTDTGPGITADELALLFQPFQQLDERLTRSHEGTGLGLVLSKRLVEMHGGNIWVKSSPGVGSTFGFALPLQPLPAASTKQHIMDVVSSLFTWQQMLSHLGFIKAYYDRHGGGFGLLHLTLSDGEKMDCEAVSQDLREAMRQYEIVGTGDHKLDFYFILLDLDADGMEKAIARLCQAAGVPRASITAKSAIYRGGSGDDIDALLGSL